MIKDGRRADAGRRGGVGTAQAPTGNWEVGSGGEEGGHKFLSAHAQARGDTFLVPGHAQVSVSVRFRFCCCAPFQSSVGVIAVLTSLLCPCLRAYHLLS